MTNQMRLMPDFLIIGAQRCGTSSLYFYLTDHPNIVPAFNKEIHFFDENYVKGLRWYRAQFPSALQKYYVEHVRKHGFVTGEATPSYLFHPHTAGRISEIMPRVKLIVLLRNPVDRAYSQHWYNVKAKQIEPLSFKDAIEAEQERIAGEREKMLADENYVSPTYRPFSYLTRGIYIDQLRCWMDHYPKEQFLILKSEDLYSNPGRSVKQALEFLGVSSAEIDTNKEYRRYKVPTKAGYKVKDAHPKLDPELRKYLVDYFRPHNARLYELCGRNFDWDN